MSGLGLFLSILLKAAFSLDRYRRLFLNPHQCAFTTDCFNLSYNNCFLNLLGVGKVSSRRPYFLSLCLLASLGIGSINGFDSTNLEPLFTNGKEELFVATALVFVSFAGVTKVAAIAEEIIEPEKNLPKGILASLLIVTFIYCSISLILAGHFSADTIGGDLKPIYTPVQIK